MMLGIFGVGGAVGLLLTWVFAIVLIAIVIYLILRITGRL